MGFLRIPCLDAKKNEEEPQNQNSEKVDGSVWCGMLMRVPNAHKGTGPKGPVVLKCVFLNV